ncbi:uncharacterized protein BO80DRAFT_476979 [Aspergillus ibericus CBS 121593]|uniref:DUF676 domain-containing protein n=1 Tax=Aspergillus ibericus CBS 121593 TaxID=1448316 RepID=A0A395GWK5_9EURO|nr:hypothetical protein BO80DRAFT_476979 [Aspergillus ibericus CBS 121593]RAK99960.1 hypothetical protein BO80DRAFT_476979 [Aspergillus ibericus CBS 121593]
MGIYESVISISADVFRDANAESIRRLLETVFERIKNTPDLISPNLLLDTVKSLTWYVLATVFGTVGSISSIREAVYRNQLNAPTFSLVWDQAAELAKFLLELLEAAKCYYLADGERDEDDEHVLYAEFNELDFSQHMNRHAAICQVQRLALSVIYILKNLFKPVTFSEIKMSEESTLQSDRGIELRRTHQTKTVARSAVNRAEERKETGRETGENTSEPTSETTGKKTSKKTSPDSDVTVAARHEKWFFVNGVGGEIYWLQLACNKLRAMFSREIEGIFNRGDGLLWDLIECAGQRRSHAHDSDTDGDIAETDVDKIVGGQKDLIDCTASSREAQALLLSELRQALDNSPPGQYIIIIAHSQGCLLLRSVLEKLIIDATADSILKKKLKERLCVFTFGSPSMHWKIQESSSSTPADAHMRYLSSHVLRTEHFANRQDFVAQLGVLSEGCDYGSDEIFINEEKDWIGHLFGTQYSFDPNHYKNTHSHHSWLLACRYGRTIEEAKAGPIDSS